MCWGRGGLWYFPLINQHLLRGVRKKTLSWSGGLQKMKGKNKEIIIAHHLDKLWILPYFGTFSVFVHFSLLKQNCPRTLSMTGGPWTPSSRFVLTPIILVIITLILFRLNRWGECGRGKTITQFFSISFNRKEMLICIFETWLFRPFQGLSLTPYSTVVIHEIIWSWRAIASPQTSFGVRSSRIHSPSRSLSPTDRGEEMNAWRTNPKERLRGL